MAVGPTQERKQLAAATCFVKKYQSLSIVGGLLMAYQWSINGLVMVSQRHQCFTNNTVDILPSLRLILSIRIMPLF